MHPSDLESLARTESARLERRAARMVGQVHASDVVQEVFLRVWQRARDSLTLTPAYLGRAVRNAAIDHLRHERLNLTLPQRITEQQYAAPVPTPEQIVMARDQLQHIDRALRALPERCRHIFLLHRRLGCSYAEIAEALDVSLSTVTRDMARAILACQSIDDAE